MNAHIQIQDSSGNWLTINTLMVNTPNIIATSMREASFNYPGFRIRAVDENGKILDIL